MHVYDTDLPINIYLSLIIMSIQYFVLKTTLKLDLSRSNSLGNKLISTMMMYSNTSIADFNLIFSADSFLSVRDNTDSLPRNTLGDILDVEMMLQKNTLSNCRSLNDVCFR